MMGTGIGDREAIKLEEGSMSIQCCAGSRKDSRRYIIQDCWGSFTPAQGTLQQRCCVDAPVPKSPPMSMGTTSYIL
jgi:hypothetical protein